MFSTFRAHSFPLVLLALFLAISGVRSSSPLSPPDARQYPSDLFPDPAPAAYRFELTTHDPITHVVVRDTVDFILHEHLTDQIVAYGPMVNGGEDSVKTVARGHGWRVLRSDGFAEYWMETGKGVHISDNWSLPDLGPDTTWAGLAVPRVPIPGDGWKSDWRARTTVVSVSPVEFDGKTYPAIEVQESSGNDSMTEQKRRILWAIGLGPVEISRSRIGPEEKYRLLELVPDGPAPLVNDLNLSEIDLSKEPLTSLHRYRNARRLFVWTDELGDVDIPGLNTFPRLEVLEFRGTPITGSSLSQLDLDHLRVLDLAWIPIRDAHLGDLPNLEGLVSLDLRGTGITDAGVEALSGAKSLRRLVLGGNSAGYRMGTARLVRGAERSQVRGSLTNASCRTIGDLVQLQSLTLSDTHVTDDGILGLSGLKDLQELDLSNTRITDTAVASLIGMRRLKRLNLANTLISDRSLARISDLPALQELDISGTLVTDAGLRALAGNPSLRVLRMRETRVTDRSIAVLSTLTALQELDAIGTRMTSRTEEELAEAATGRIVRVRPDPSPLLEMVAGIPDALMRYGPGSSPDSLSVVESDRQALAGLPDFRIIPREPPLAYRYTRHIMRSEAIALVDTLDLIFLQPVTDVHVQNSWSLRSGTGNESAPVEIGGGWQILDPFGNLTYWIETDTGMYRVGSVGSGPDHPATGSLEVPADPDSLTSWSLYYDASISVKGTGWEEILGEARRTVSTVMNHRGEGSTDLWAYGVGLVRQTYQSRPGSDGIRLELVDTIERGHQEQISILVLRDLRIDDTALDAFLDYSGVRTLALCNARLSETGLSRLAAFSHLKHLDLADAEVTGEGFREVPFLGELEILDLSGTRLNDSTVHWLPNLPMLKSLNLRNTYVTDEGLRALSNAQDLESLMLGNRARLEINPPYQGFSRGGSSSYSSRRTFITGRGLRYLEGIPSLEMIDLSYTDLAEENLGPLTRMPSLHHLDLRGTRIGDGGIEILAKIRRLTVLELGGTAITDEALRILAALSDLERLSLRDTAISSEGIGFLRDLKNLRVLDVNETQVDPSATATLKTMRWLKWLSLPRGDWSELREALPDTEIWPRLPW